MIHAYQAFVKPHTHIALALTNTVQCTNNTQKGENMSRQTKLNRVVMLLNDVDYERLKTVSERRLDSMSNICRQLVIEWLNEQDDKAQTPQGKS